MPRLKPGHPAPNLALPLAGGGQVRIAELAPESYRLVFAYRGKHCPKCREQLEEVEREMDLLEAEGIVPLAMSCDDRERAESAKAEWGLEKLRVAHDLKPDWAEKDWGLWLSTSIKEEEPETFCEPGVFLIAPGGEVFAAWTQSFPFARPGLEALVETVRFVKENGYPSRGRA